ncbi:unnamed protein product [Effrenium voratum]|nr:unnamed protein product [Effrenium voratum]
MAREITVRQLSGAATAFAVPAGMTVRELKAALHGWLPCEDESKRNMSSVEVIVDGRCLLNNKEMVSEVIPGREVLAVFSIKPVTCSSFSASGCELEDLRVVEIPAGRQVEAHAFIGCSSLASVTIPNSVTKIGELAFNGCSSLASVTIPNSVTEIWEGAFADCSSLASLTIPNSVTDIWEGAFAGCSSLASVTISNSVTVIRELAFAGCSSLASVTIPDSVTDIRESVFEGCSSLASLTIPMSVTNIGESAFEG